ncbi:hypothetical protein GDO78_019177 [Eleutherodactylus coqui]|uniref:Uncharacterized protein n=1 Tax=Eleutherodactylus coqui TaxID=57060 RepID=A0A8J6C6Q4_ELECQ|nr:hypothetical protein GDO78_019177 [Eleutherodactylus coqui]
MLLLSPGQARLLPSVTSAAQGRVCQDGSKSCTKIISQEVAEPMA